jgi:hypothetical protein
VQSMSLPSKTTSRPEPKHRGHDGFLALRMALRTHSAADCRLYLALARSLAVSLLSSCSVNFAIPHGYHDGKMTASAPANSPSWAISDK